MADTDLQNIASATRVAVICEASDGLQAIQKASELQPSIVLLNIGIPFLNGIEAAQTIHQKCPNSKIVFVTQDGDDEVQECGQAQRVMCSRKMRK